MGWFNHENKMGKVGKKINDNVNYTNMVDNMTIVPFISMGKSLIERDGI